MVFQDWTMVFQHWTTKATNVPWQAKTPTTGFVNLTCKHTCEQLIWTGCRLNHSTKLEGIVVPTSQKSAWQKRCTAVHHTRHAEKSLWRACCNCSNQISSCSAGREHLTWNKCHQLRQLFVQTDSMLAKRKVLNRLCTWLRAKNRLHPSGRSLHLPRSDHPHNVVDCMKFKKSSMNLHCAHMFQLQCVNFRYI
jgi:hypothetical protein